MDIVTTFASNLFSFRFGKDSELNCCIRNWTNQEWLFEYFKANSGILDFFEMSEEEAVMETKRYAMEIVNLLKNKSDNLNEIFEPLNTGVTELARLPKKKYKCRWIRLYALHIEDKYYVITGSAIKQSKSMQEHELTNEQLLQFDWCRQYLIDNDVCDIDGLRELMVYGK